MISPIMPKSLKHVKDRVNNTLRSLENVMVFLSVGFARFKIVCIQVNRLKVKFHPSFIAFSVQ